MTKHTVLDEIRDWDPEWDPIPGALDAAGVTRETWQAACDRVRVDGYHGPISTADWREQDGREPASCSEALKIVVQVLEHIDDYRGDAPIVSCDHGPDCLDDDGGPTWRCENDHCSDCLGDGCEGHEDENARPMVEARDIRRALCPWLVEIYGHLPS